jgi:hypothetical protein
MDLRNQTELEFMDISSEELRTYVFPENEVTVIGPHWLAVSASGGHRLLDDRGICWYIPPKWLAIRWKVREDQPHFVK